MHEGWIDTDGTVASVDEKQTRGGEVYSVVFTYKVNGEWYGGTYTTSYAYRQGDSIALLYDPRRPERNNLVQRETIRHWVIGGVIAILALLLLSSAFSH